MTIDRAVLAVYGVMVLAGLLLSYFVHFTWLWMPILVGVDLLQASFTGFCPIAAIFRMMGVKPGPAFG